MPETSDLVSDTALEPIGAVQPRSDGIEPDRAHVVERRGARDDSKAALQRPPADPQPRANGGHRQDVRRFGHHHAVGLRNDVGCRHPGHRRRDAAGFRQRPEQGVDDRRERERLGLLAGKQDEQPRPERFSRVVRNVQHAGARGTLRQLHLRGVQLPAERFAVESDREQLHVPWPLQREVGSAAQRQQAVHRQGSTLGDRLAVAWTQRQCEAQLVPGQAALLDDPFAQPLAKDVDTAAGELGEPAAHDPRRDLHIALIPLRRRRAVHVEVVEDVDVAGHELRAA